jgi:glycolate oxidase
VANYDLKSLLIGSEGTLAVITAVWLRLVPAPEATLPLAAFYPDARTGCRAVEALLGYGAQLAAVEFVDGEALRITGHALPGGVPAAAGFLVLGAADGTTNHAGEQISLAEGGAQRRSTRRSPAAVGGLAGDLGMARRGLAGGTPATANLHCALLFDRDEHGQPAAALAAAEELFELASELAGSPTGEHGVGTTKRKAAARATSPRHAQLQAALKQSFDPKGLLTPGKKIESAH